MQSSKRNLWFRKALYDLMHRKSLGIWFKAGAIDIHSVYKLGSLLMSPERQPSCNREENFLR